MRSLRLSQHLLRWIALPLGCLLAAAVVGAASEPPSEDGASVFVFPLSPAQLENAGIPDFEPPALAGAKFHANETAGIGSGSIKASRASEDRALSVARAGADDYLRWLTARQDRWLKNPLNRGDDPEVRTVRRSVLDDRARYVLKYVSPAAGAGDASPALRGALLGLLVGLLAAALLATRRPEPAPAGGDGAAMASAPAPTTPWIGAAALASAGVVALASTASTGGYTFGFIALTFLVAFAYALRGGPTAIRTLLICVIAVAPFRGAILALADAIDLPNAYLSFNAIQPSLIAACAAAVLLAHRELLFQAPRALRYAWAAIALACVLDLATQTVGLKLYAIGLAQYLVYPTFALLAWPLLRPRDRQWLVWALCGLGAAVALSEFLEAGGVYFTEAVKDPKRLGGATGSYLHSSIFLGTTVVLALGALFARWSRRNALLAIGVVGVMVGGLALTYSRGGFGIAILGGLVLLAVLHGRDRLRLVGVAVAATALGLALGAVIGPSSGGALASRTSSGASIEGDPGNAKRLEAMKEAFNSYRALPAKEKVLGKGIASTGNAGKLTSQEPDPTESYPLKVLVETGAIGALLIGAVLIWAVVCFARTAWRAEDRVLKGIGAAGLGLSAESIIYPTLEVQLIALTFWLLLAVALKGPAWEAWRPVRGVRPAEPVPEPTGSPRG